MKLPVINEDRCEQPAGSCADPRCADPGFAAANPDICPDGGGGGGGGGNGSLVVKPEMVDVCAPTEIWFTASMRTPQGDILLDSGVTWASSDPSVLTLEELSGKATALTGGMATVTATWQGLNAYAQVNVLGTDGTCCDDVQVLIAAAVDNSLSMGQPFGPGFSSKLAAGKALVNGLMAELLEKDRAAVEWFNASVGLQQDLTNVVADLQAAVSAIPQSRGTTNLAQAFDSALALLGLTDTAAAPSVVGGVSSFLTLPPATTGGGGGNRLHGYGAPAPSLGQSGDTYVDDGSGGFYWKAVDGWHP